MQKANTHTAVTVITHNVGNMFLALSVLLILFGLTPTLLDDKPFNLVFGNVFGNVFVTVALGATAAALLLNRTNFRWGAAPMRATVTLVAAVLLCSLSFPGWYVEPLVYVGFFVGSVNAFMSVAMLLSAWLLVQSEGTIETEVDPKTGAKTDVIRYSAAASPDDSTTGQLRHAQTNDDLARL
jgi:hypothetical protein